MKPLPIRIKLTLWYSVMFATAAILLSSTSWWMLRRAIDATVQQDFAERVDDIRMQLHRFGADLDPNDTQARFDAIYRFRDDGKWLQIRGWDGRWIYRSSRMTSLDAPLPLPELVPKAGVTREYRQGTRYVRAFSSSITVDGRAYAVETGESMNKQRTLLLHFGLGLLLLTPAMLTGAIMAGHWVSRKALAPVAMIANEARRISDRNLNQRLPISRAKDELSHLSITLNNMLARIDVGFRSVRDFTANASHELRTPIAQLRTEVEIALLYPRSVDEYRDTLEHLQKVAVYMTGLTESLLALARAEAGSEVLRLSPIDLRPIVRTMLEEWAPVAARLSINLSSEAAESHATKQPMPLLVFGDRVALLRLLRIWLDNACKFTPPGGRISILAEAAGDFVLLGVQDSGIGIPADQRERIFERFYRINGDTGQRRDGSGLGLNLAAWIAEQHNTSIILDTTPGLGSCFNMSLAKVREDRPSADQSSHGVYTDRH